jgi:hypothetical protein
MTLVTLFIGILGDESKGEDAIDQCGSTPQLEQRVCLQFVPYAAKCRRAFCGSRLIDDSLTIR